MAGSFNRELVYKEAYCYTTDTQHDQLTDALERSWCLTWIRRSAHRPPNQWRSVLLHDLKDQVFDLESIDPGPSQLDRLCWLQ